MLASFAPWFYWNFIGRTRDSFLDIIHPNARFRETYKIGKYTYVLIDHYPVINSPGAIRRITNTLEALRTFQRAIAKC